MFFYSVTCHQGLAIFSLCKKNKKLTICLDEKQTEGALFKIRYR